MGRRTGALALGLLLLTPAAPVDADDATWAVVVHGGAGLAPGQRLDTPREAALRAALGTAAERAAAIVRDGGEGLDAVVAAIEYLEDDPNFNAGKGAVFTAAGANELDASIMDGTRRRAGAVAGVTRVKNPIRLARAVMDASPHVMMAGAGAEAFAEGQGMALVDPSYFATEARWDDLIRRLDARGEPIPEPPASWGTVGAVVLDTHRGLSAGTSTGGLTGKLYGRIGDSPVIGAGTYAEDGVCAISATGHGEYFIRAAVARTICARAELAGEPLAEAARVVLVDELAAMRPGVEPAGAGRGGVIFVGPRGETGWRFTTPAMFRARIGSALPLEIRIYGPEDGVAAGAP